VRQGLKLGLSLDRALVFSVFTFPLLLTDIFSILLGGLYRRKYL